MPLTETENVFAFLSWEQQRERKKKKKENDDENSIQIFRYFIENTSWNPFQNNEFYDFAFLLYLIE